MSTQSNTGNQTNKTENVSEVKKAADNVSPKKLAENLQKDKPVHTPEKLTESQETPFIDEDLRTDN